MIDQKDDEKSTQFAKTEEDAIARFGKYKKSDPFPQIAPALLNSADISDYIAKTGMIYPYYPDKLKSASYEVNLLGQITEWDDKGKKIEHTLKKGDAFTLKKNSIAFLTPESTFRLPAYIAIRFNLKITFVQRGLLLGTGPLVDPGFEGKLSIPLHNLTANDYTFEGGEGLIWVEFTKISHYKDWVGKDEDASRFGRYIDFPNEKKYLEQEDYLKKARKGQGTNTIRSSIPEAVETAVTAAKKMRNWNIGLVVAAVIGIVTWIAMMFYGNCQVMQLVKDSTNFVQQTKKDFIIEKNLKTKEIADLKKEIISLKNTLNEIKKPSLKHLIQKKSPPPKNK